MSSPFKVTHGYLISGSNLIAIAVQKPGYRAPKKKQIAIINKFLNGRDVFSLSNTACTYVCMHVRTYMCICN